MKFTHMRTSPSFPANGTILVHKGLKMGPGFQALVLSEFISRSIFHHELVSFSYVQRLEGCSGVYCFRKNNMAHLDLYYQYKGLQIPSTFVSRVDIIIPIFSRFMASLVI